MMARTPRLLGKELKKYFKEHAKRIRVRATESSWWGGRGTRYEVTGFYVITKELNVFKMNYSTDGRTKVITNLTIPVGAKVYAPDFAFNEDHADDGYRCHDRKMRASEAIVHSSATMYAQKPVAVARSGWDSSFKYAAGKTIKPRGDFDMDGDQCASGIHFFLNLQDAIEYN
jgi:hypothetical protein